LSVDNTKHFCMEADKNSIITEDGQRLNIKDGLITGTEDPGPGLAYETGNLLDEKDKKDAKEEDKTGSVCRQNNNGGSNE